MRQQSVQIEIPNAALSFSATFVLPNQRRWIFQESKSGSNINTPHPRKLYDPSTTREGSRTDRKKRKRKLQRDKKEVVAQGARSIVSWGFVVFRDKGLQ
jgi:hypothetical protein